jgi:hypothetical protein
MPANNDPIYSRLGDIQAVAVTAANTSSQGGGTIGTDIFLAFQADATNGGYVREIRFSLAESTISTASTGTVGRVFVSSVSSGATTSSNTHLICEVALATQTPSSTVAAVPICVPLNFALPAGWTILVTNHAAPAANTHWKAVTFGGKY